MYRTAALLVISAALVADVFAQSEVDPPGESSGRQLKVFTNADGTGTANRLALWTDADTVGDSQVYQISGNIGIGTDVLSGTRRLVVDVASVAESGLQVIRLGLATRPRIEMLINSAGTPYGVISVGDSTTTRSLALNPGGGNVGIGVTNPSQKLEVAGNVRVLPASGSFSVGGAAAPGYPFFATNTAGGVSSAIQLTSSFSTLATSYIGNFGQYGTYISHNREPQIGTFMNAAVSPNQANAAQLVVGDTHPMRMRMFSIANYPDGVESLRFVVKYTGNVGIGPGVEALMAASPDKRLVVSGDIEVSGNINAKYQDIAEWVPASTDLAPGTVVVLDAAIGNGVKASSFPYDTGVAGVISEQPGITLGESSPSKEKVATTGRVRVKVDATAAPIAVGDLLVTSDRPGYAMRSNPVEVAGISLHRPGTIVGKALEPLASGDGEILVLLSLQ